MAKDPIVFAMANPDPEISYEDALSVRSDIIMATGRSDYPNQVNNVLGFPFIFRGALDVRATAINDEMKLAAAHALVTLCQGECAGCGYYARTATCRFLLEGNISSQSHSIRVYYYGRRRR